MSLLGLGALSNKCFNRAGFSPIIVVRKMKNNKHWNPTYKRGRQIKIMMLDFDKKHEKNNEVLRRARRLTDFDADGSASKKYTMTSEFLSDAEREKTEEEMRSFMKQRGIPPFRPWNRERPYYMGSTGQVVDPYSPPEDATKETGILERIKSLPEKTVGLWYKDIASTRKIRKHDPDFVTEKFGEVAKRIFIDAHTALMNRDEKRLHLLVTESLFPRLWHELKLRTVKWEWVETLAPPQLVRLRAGQPSQTSTSIFGQVTVGFKSKQILAIYDQFGHLMLGHPEIPQDVIEYAVFEKDLSDEYGRWRLMEKIQSSKAKKQPIRTTYRVSDMDTDEIELTKEEEQELEMTEPEGDEDEKAAKKA